MKLDEVIPFGRSLDEYRHMFALSDADLDKKIVGVADGPASVNAELMAMGKHMLSVDPLYRFSAAEIKKQFDRVADGVFEQVQASSDNWVWIYHKNLQSLKENRLKVIRNFAADFEKGKQEKRYLVDELPRLNFKDDEFDLALCSHFLFLYSEHFIYEFHLDSVLELLRIAREVRIFPLMTLEVKKSAFVEPLIKELEQKAFLVTIEKVDYEMQKGGNKMLKIAKMNAAQESN